MTTINRKLKAPPVRTHGGAVAKRAPNALEQLKRTALACLLWEDSFYEDGKSVAERITTLASQVHPYELLSVAAEARQSWNLRSVPILLLKLAIEQPLAAWGEIKRNEALRMTANVTLRRADDLTELFALWWTPNKDRPIPYVMDQIAEDALNRFDKYQLSKYAARGAVRLRDVLFLTHAKPRDEAHIDLFKQLADDSLDAADTWESQLSAGKNKLAVFERLLGERKMGGLAVLRNLRAMHNEGVSPTAVKLELARTAPKSGILPFQYLIAMDNLDHAQRKVYGKAVEGAMLSAARGLPKLPGRTLLVIDTSGSMSSAISAKSSKSRIDVAFALAILAREMCEDAVIYCTAGDDGRRVHATGRVPATHGFELIEEMRKTSTPLGGGGIFLTQAMEYIESKETAPIDRVIVFTDEQDCDLKLKPASAKRLGKTNYIMNVASYSNGIGYGPWTTITGFSENLLRYIVELEKIQ